MLRLEAAPASMSPGYSNDPCACHCYPLRRRYWHRLSPWMNLFVLPSFRCAASAGCFRQRRSKANAPPSLLSSDACWNHAGGGGGGGPVGRSAHPRASSSRGNSSSVGGTRTSTASMLVQFFWRPPSTTPHTRARCPHCLDCRHCLPASPHASVASEELRAGRRESRDGESANRGSRPSLAPQPSR